MKVHVFIEGGGDQDKTVTACKKAFRLFFEKALGDAPSPRLSACGSRDDAFRDFRRKVEQDRETFAVLLVDSEDPVTEGASTWGHLQRRDGWTSSVNIASDQVHLMVECMEAWFLADRQILIDHYGRDFRANSLPRNPNPEQISKRDLMDGLSRATRDTTKGEYHKTRYGFPILEKLDPAAVRARCPHADALLSLLAARLLP